MKKWSVRSADDRLAAQFAKQCDLGMTTLRLMTARGFSDFQQVADFFTNAELGDPFAIADMQQAVDAINEYIDSFELICVYGDYDCDGITATALLYSYLESMGANVTYYINEREQGYGMNIEAVRALAKRGVKLIVTVDNGISCAEEAEEVYRLGMKLVVTDHHQVPEQMPRAEAVVDLHRADCPSEYKDLAGVGVTLKLCAALDGGSFDAVLEQYSDICAIGTVGDLVPLTGENRTLVQKGLLYLPNTENYGLSKLLEISASDTSKLDSGTLGFQICPRINAAGRFASPLIALDAILTEDPDEAERLVEQLSQLNQQRKETEREIFDQIKQTIDSDPTILNKRVLVLSGKGWHHGVIGIVSARVMEFYGKPNFIISTDEDGNARGSARSLKGFNIFKCMTYCEELLQKFGGHECAGGLSLEAVNIPAFDRKVQEYAEQQPHMPVPLAECDLTALPQDLTVESVNSLNEQLRPFGVGNPQPLFYLPACKVMAKYPLSGGKHTKLDISYNGGRFQALMFSHMPESVFAKAGDSIDIAANVSVNEYNGRKSVSVKVADIKPAGMDTGRYFAARDSYEKLRRGVGLPANFLRKMTPSRKELVYVYKLLGQLGTVTIDELFMRINHPAFNYCKLRLAVDIFAESGLVSFSPSEQTAAVIAGAPHADLAQAPTMKMLAELLENTPG